jgi:hypothetical protein
LQTEAVAGCEKVLGGLDDSSRQRSPRCWPLVAAKQVGIKIDVTGPDDGAELAVDGDGLEHVAIVAHRGERAASLQQSGEIDFVYSPVAEGQPKPALRERLNVGDRCAGRGHGSGAIGAEG